MKSYLSAIRWAAVCESFETLPLPTATMISTPASRARAIIAVRSPSKSSLSMCACESMYTIHLRAMIARPPHHPSTSPFNARLRLMTVGGAFRGETSAGGRRKRPPLEHGLRRRQQAVSRDHVHKEQLVLALDVGHAAQRGGNLVESERGGMPRRLHVFVNVAVFEPAREVHRQQPPRHMTGRPDDVPDQPQLRFEVAARARAQACEHAAHAVAVHPFFAFNLSYVLALGGPLHRFPVPPVRVTGGTFT